MSQDASSRSKPVWMLFAALVVFNLVIGIVAMLRGVNRRSGEPLLVHCAASLKTVMTALAKDYENATGTRVDLSFGGSQTLLANIAISRRGDLFLPADESYIAAASEKQLIGLTLPLARQTAVLAVAKGNRTNIRSLNDFRERALTLSQANPDAAAIGKLVRAATITNGLWAVLSNRTTVFKPSVTDAANDVKLGAVDAAIVWDSMAPQYPDLDFVSLPELANVQAKVTISVLTCSTQIQAAEKFARFVASPESGLRHFKTNGFQILAAQP